jgi:iron complex transport system substrate-binding protein
LGVGTSIIGGHSTCTFPAEAAFKEVYDYNGDPEKIIAAEPDLVLIRPFISRKAPDFVAALVAADIQVVSLYPESFANFDDYIQKLALLTGTEVRAEELLMTFHQELVAISQQTARISSSDKQSIFFESTEVNLRTVTPDSMVAQAIALAGGINVAADVEPVTEGGSIAAFGVENILSMANEIDVYVSQRGAMNAGGDLKTIMGRPGFSTIKAVQNGRVFVINEKIISSPTFRYFVGVRELARYLYPRLLDDVGRYMIDEPATKRDLARLIVMGGHLPVFVPASTKYYSTKHEGHIYGLFTDLDWSDPDFDFVETAVQAGFIQWRLTEGRQYFDPEAKVTRQELARAIYLMGDFGPINQGIEISDIEACDKPMMIQNLVDHGVFDLNGGKFEPLREVTQKEIVQALLK